jgi:hypothetical protein
MTVAVSAAYVVLTVTYSLAGVGVMVVAALLVTAKVAGVAAPEVVAVML